MDKGVVKDKIEKAWISRAEAQGLKPKSAAYKKAEMEFFVGAMTAIDALDENPISGRLSSNVPVIWVVNALSGRPIATEGSGE